MHACGAGLLKGRPRNIEELPRTRLSSWVRRTAMRPTTCTTCGVPGPGVTGHGVISGPDVSHCHVTAMWPVGTFAFGTFT